MAVNEQEVWKALRQIQDPERGGNIVDLNMVRDLRITEGQVSFAVAPSRSGDPIPVEMEAEIKKAVILVSGVKKVDVDTGRQSGGQAPPKQGDFLNTVRHVIAVASAKGGVGKSTVSVNLAAALAAMGSKVGLLDADIYGPNVPLMAGAEGAEPTVAVYTDASGNNREFIEPIEVNGMKVMSMGFLVHAGQPIMWRGPMLNSAMRQFLGQVDWGELDYLIIDLPPGTGDVQISLLQMVPVSGIVHVTTPQEVALQDVRRGIAMFASQKVPVLGIIENMSFFQCPKCMEKTAIFSTGGGQKISDELNVPVLGVVPLALAIREAGDAGTPIALKDPTGPQGSVFVEAAQKLKAQLESLEDSEQFTEVRN